MTIRANNRGVLNDSNIDESILQKILDLIIKDEISIQSVEIEN